MQLDRLLGIDCGQTVGLLQLPAIDEAVMTRGALQVDAQKRLAHALGELDRHRLTGADIAAPFDSTGEPFAVRRWRHEISRKLVVRLVLDQSTVEPLAD